MAAADPTQQTEAFMREVGLRLQQARIAAGLSLQDVAGRLGLKSRAAVGHWETGRNPIDINKLHRLARYYDTTVVALVAERMTDEDIVALTRRQLEEAKAGASAEPAGKRPSPRKPPQSEGGLVPSQRGPNPQHDPKARTR